MRWLHISDLHIDSSCDPETSYGFFGSFFRGLKERVSAKKVDFIIFTGDLFHQGRWNKGQKEAALKFLQKVYEVCSQACDWEDRSPKKVRLFYCPGNHDVFRSAFCNEGDFVLLRSNLLESVRDNTGPAVQRDGFFCDNADDISVERKVLTESTFSLFDEAMKDFGMYSTDGNDKEHLYEYRKFTHEAVLQTSPVVALNTALLAGQSYSQDIIKKELEEAWDEFQKAHAKFDFKTAKEQYGSYEKAYLKQQGLLRDDEKHMCFISRSAADDLKASISGCRYPILFGHHPISSYSKQAGEAFFNFARDVHAHIYLCGHAHRPKGEMLHHGAAMNQHVIYEITVGGIFVDKSGYNEASFAIEELSNNGDDNEAIFSVSIFTHIGEDKDQFGFDQWTERTWQCDRLPTSIRTNPANQATGAIHHDVDDKKDVKNPDVSVLMENMNEEDEGKKTATNKERNDGYHFSDDGIIWRAYLKWLSDKKN